MALLSISLVGSFGRQSGWPSLISGKWTWKRLSQEPSAHPAPSPDRKSDCSSPALS